MVVELFKAIFASSCLLLPAIILLWMWNQETPTSLTNKGKNEVGYGEKIKSP
jgi:hypothetical protein